MYVKMLCNLESITNKLLIASLLLWFYMCSFITYLIHKQLLKVHHAIGTGNLEMPFYLGNSGSSRRQRSQVESNPSVSVDLSRYKKRQKSCSLGRQCGEMVSVERR